MSSSAEAPVAIKFDHVTKTYKLYENCLLYTSARHIGRVVDMREGDGGHRDGHLLERRLSLPLDDGSRVRLVRHAAGGTRILTVSYTHLDVYKRQKQGWLRDQYN